MNPFRDPLPEPSCFGDVAWHAWSPDLRARNFWLWGFLKSKFFVTKPYTIAELKNCIRNKFAAIPISMILRESNDKEWVSEWKSEKNI